MSLDEVFRDEPMVSHVEAIAEVAKHGASIPEFYAELGLADEYNGAEVLGWLGY